MWRLYRITPVQYDRLLERQVGKCANTHCKSPPSGKYGKLHLDHNNETGAIRGFLCHSCNAALGHAKEDPQRLLGLIEDIKKHNQPITALEPQDWRDDPGEGAHRSTAMGVGGCIMETIKADHCQIGDDPLPLAPSWYPTKLARIYIVYTVSCFVLSAEYPTILVG